MDTRRIARQSTVMGKRVPPHCYFVTSAVFHYLGPAFAVLLFHHLDVLGVAWLRISTAAVVFAAWRRPWRSVRRLPTRDRWTLLGLGVVLGAMNCCFYLAIARLPLGTVGAIEFLGPIALAALGAWTGRNLAALASATLGVLLLTDVRIADQPVGFVFAFANCGLFAFYVVLGHRLARDGGGAGIDRLGGAMLVAVAVATPFGIVGATPALTSPLLLAAGIGVGICSSVIPYVCDQLAMARLPRATFALLLALLPATATVIGLTVLRQIPTAAEVAGVSLVVVGVALHREAPRYGRGDPRPEEVDH
jgi:inner membrane transporter RhtA